MASNDGNAAWKKLLAARSPNKAPEAGALEAGASGARGEFGIGAGQWCGADIAVVVAAIERSSRASRTSAADVETAVGVDTAGRDDGDKSLNDGPACGTDKPRSSVTAEAAAAGGTTGEAIGV